jgi:hypothetical protein
LPRNGPADDVIAGRHSPSAEAICQEQSEQVRTIVTDATYAQIILFNGARVIQFSLKVQHLLRNFRPVIQSNTTWPCNGLSVDRGF